MNTRKRLGWLELIEGILLLILVSSRFSSRAKLCGALWRSTGSSRCSQGLWTLRFTS